MTTPKPPSELTNAAEAYAQKVRAERSSSYNATAAGITIVLESFRGFESGAKHILAEALPLIRKLEAICLPDRELSVTWKQAFDFIRKWSGE